MEISTGRSHGKIILMGEHSVVYGMPSIALPFFDAEVVATVTCAQQLEVDCDFYTGLVASMPELLKSVQTTIMTCLKELDQLDTPLHIQIESTIPIERGMGSSAAVAVATTRALFHYFNQPLTQDKLLAIVDIAEHIAHGNPSGLDALLTSSDQAFRYVKGEPFTPIHCDLDATLVIADTGKTGQTKEAVAAVKQLMAQPEYAQKIVQLGDATMAAEQCLATGDVIQLGALMNEAHHLLKALSVSSAELDQLVQVARQSGAYGAKLTGGGRGGCLIALSRPDQATHIACSLQKAGAVNTWMLPMKGI